MCRYAAIITAAVALLTGCDSGISGADHEVEYVVESYQQVGEPLAPVRLSRTVALDATYGATASAARGAEVYVDLLADDGTVAEHYAFAESENRPGLYLPLVEDGRPRDASDVLPLRTYRLAVAVPETGEAIRATTRTPDALELVRMNADTATYGSAEQFEAVVTRPAHPDRQAVFVFSTRTLAPSAEALTPLYRELIDFDSGEGDLDDLREVLKVELPPLNEANYEAGDDGTLRIRLPWLAIAFYGPNEITASAIDDNLFDFIRSRSVQQGLSTLSPGEIPNVIDHVEGGRGVFGSFASATARVYVRQNGE